jgi:hypothetical protein
MALSEALPRHHAPATSGLTLRRVDGYAPDQVNRIIASTYAMSRFNPPKKVQMNPISTEVSLTLRRRFTTA